MMRYLTMLLIIPCCFAGQLFAQSKKAESVAPSPATFDIYLGQGDKGTETFKVAKKKDHYLLTSDVRLKKYGEPVSSEQVQELAADWSPLHYSLKTKMAKEERTTEASVSGGKVQMHSESGTDIKNKTIDLHSPALVFDNIVPSQFQVLIYQYMASHIQKPLEFQMLVPQVLAQFSGVLNQSGTDQGKLNEHPVALRKYTLLSRGANLQIWTDNKGELMRVSLPMKNTEFVRTGFTMSGLERPGKQKSVVMLH